MDNADESWGSGRQAESESGWGEPPPNPEKGYWPGSEDLPENTASSDQDPPSSNKKGQNETGGRNTQSSHVKNNHKESSAPNTQGDDNWHSSPKMDNDRNDWESKKAEKGRGRNPEKGRADDKSPNWEGPKKFQQKGGGSWRDNNNNRNSHRRDWSEDSEPRSPRGRGRGGPPFPRHERDNYRRDPRGDSDFRGHNPRSPPPPRGDGNRNSDRHEKINDESMKESASSKVGSLNDSIHAPKQDPPYVNKDRVLSGGNAHQRMGEEELSKRMEQIQLQNKKLLEKRKIVEEDEEAFRKEDEEFRKKEFENLEIQRKKKEEEEEDKRRREYQQKQLQEQLDNDREENARLKIKNRDEREWDKEKEESGWNSRQNQRNNFDSRNNSYRSGNDNETDRKSSRSEDSNYDRRNSRQGSNEYEDYGRRNSRNNGGNGGDYARRNSRGNHNESGPRNNYRGDNNFGKNNRPGRGRGGRGRGGGGRGGAASPHGTTGRRQSNDQNRDPYKPLNDNWDEDVSIEDSTWNEPKNQSKSEDQDDGGWGASDVAAADQGSGWD